MVMGQISACVNVIFMALNIAILSILVHQNKPHFFQVESSGQRKK
jgi:hypothetical protein